MVQHIGKLMSKFFHTHFNFRDDTLLEGVFELATSLFSNPKRARMCLYKWCETPGLLPMLKLRSVLFIFIHSIMLWAPLSVILQPCISTTNGKNLIRKTTNQNSRKLTLNPFVFLQNFRHMFQAFITDQRIVVQQNPLQARHSIAIHITISQRHFPPFRKSLNLMELEYKILL